jgi:hypothetical protein
LAQNNFPALRIDADDSGGSSDVHWTRRDSPRDLHVFRLASGAATLLHVHVIRIIGLPHLRFDGTPFAQQ